jgi:TPR repeat protein
MYHEGKGVKRSYPEASKWYKLAADQNYPLAQYALGTMFFNGEGFLNKNYSAAAGWYKEAAANGSAKAQRALGLMYGRGQGVPQDFVRAYMWINLAATDGATDKATDRNLIAAKMTPQQIAEAQKLAEECQARDFKNCN